MTKVGIPISQIIQFNVDHTDTLVFDDLERCKNTHDALGLINQYVEHNGCRAIVIAHDEKIISELKGRKEKLFGQTVRVVSELEDAFEYFIQNLTDANQKQFVTDHRDRLNLAIYESEIASLRIIRHVILDLARLASCLKNDHKSNTMAMSELTYTYSAFALAIRGERLSKSDILERHSLIAEFYAARGENNPENIEPKFSIFSKLHPELNNVPTIIDERLICEMLFDGHYRPEDIQSSLELSSHFLDIETVDPWLTLYNFDSLDENVVINAKEEIERRFSAVEITQPGELLHSIAFRFLMSKEGIIEDSFEDVERSGREYIETIKTSKSLPSLSLVGDPFGPQVYGSSFQGHTYWIKPEYTDHFGRLKIALRQAQLDLRMEKYPQYADELFSLFKTNIKTFHDKMYPVVSTDKHFTMLPILAYIDVGDFYSSLTEKTGEEIPLIKSVLDRRYRSSFANEPEKHELEWVKQLVELIDANANALDGFNSFRLKRMISGEVRDNIFRAEERLEREQVV